MTQTATPSLPSLLPGEDTGRADDDGIIDIKMPTLVGQAVAGATVTIYDTDGVSVLGTGIANAGGLYSIVLSQALNEGGHVITATATAPGETESAHSGTLPLTVDTMAPSAPAAPLLVAADDTGASAEDGTTSKKVLHLTGLAEPNALVQLFSAGNTTQVLASAIAGDDGTYTLTTGTLPDGIYKFELTATDVAGNVTPLSKDTAFTTVTIDSVAPPKPTAPSLAAGSDTGVLLSDGLTDVDTPVITGSTEADATVELFDGSVMVGKATANDSGAYAITAAALADGAHALTVKALDAAGNTSATSDALNIVIDTTAPTATSTPVAAVEEADSVTFTVAFSEEVTGVAARDFRLVTTGSAYGEVQSVSGSGAVYTVTVNGLGGEGTVALDLAGTAITDLAGNVATLSLTESHPVSGTNEPLTTLVSSSVSGNSSTAAYGSPSASGRLVAFSSDTPLVPSGTTAGVNNIYVTDLQTGAITLVSDADDDGPANGQSFGAGLSGDGTTIAFATTATNISTTPTQAGETNIYVANLTIGPNGITVDPDSVKLVSSGNGQQGEGQNDDGSQAEYAPVLSSDGSTVVFDSTQALVKGAESGVENVYAEKIATGVITLVSAGSGEGGNYNSDVSSISADGNLIGYESLATNLGGAPLAVDATFLPTRSYVYNMTTGVTTPIDGTDIYQPGATGDTVAYQTFDPVLSGDGTKVSYNLQYLVGNTQLQETYQYTFATGLTQSIQASSPANPYVYDFGTSSSKGGGLVLYQDNPGVYAGQNAYQIILDSTAGGTQTSLPAGYSPILTTSGDAFTFVEQPDGASSSGELYETNFNISAGVATIGTDDELSASELAAAAAGGGLAVSGTTNAPAGSTVLVQFFGASATTNTENSPAVAATVGSGGQWSTTVPVAFLQSADGPYALVVQIGTPAGASFFSIRDFIVDTAPPATPDAPKLDAGSDTTQAGDGSATNQDMPVLTGTAEAGATITLYDTSSATPTAVIGTGVADANGVYAVSPSDGLINGRHSLDVTATDAAGNVSEASGDVTFTVDTITPLQPKLQLNPKSDTGASNTDGVTNNASPTITGTGEAKTTITLYDTDGVSVLGTTTVSANGTWSLDSNNLADGTHSLTVTDTDAAGNVSPISAPLAITVDTTSPFMPTITSVNGVLVGGALAPLVTVSGDAEPDSTVTLHFDGGDDILGTTTAAEDGEYSLESDPLPAGDHMLSVVSTDLAGNASLQSIQDGVSITDNAVAPPGAPPGTPTLIVQLTDGPISGATVYADSNANGTRDTGEGSGVTDAGGQAQLADTGGELIATGGVDASTGLALDGALDAPAHSTVISPLTTLLQYDTNFAGGSLAAQQSALATLLGLQSSGTTVLTALDPTAAALGGSAALDPAIADGAPLIESAKIIDTATEFAAFLSGSSINANIDNVIAAMAKIAAQSGALDLDSQVTLNAILSSLINLVIPPSADVTNTVVAVAAATNANLDRFNAGGGAGLVTSVARVEAVAQGQVAPQLRQLATDARLIPSVTAQYTGTTLYDATAASVALIHGTPELAAGYDTGRSDNDNVIDITAPTFVGKANPGTYVTLFQYVTSTNLTMSTVVIGTAVADASGNYTVANAALASGGNVYISGPVGAVGSTTDPGVTVGELISVPLATPTLAITLDRTAASGPFILDAMVAAAPGDDANHSALVVHLDPAAEANGNGIIGTLAIFADGGTTPIGTSSADLEGLYTPVNITTAPLAVGKHILTAVETAAGGTVIAGTQSYTVTVGPASVVAGVAAAIGAIADATVHTTPPPVSEAFFNGDYDAVTSKTDRAGNYVATLPTPPSYSIASANGYDTVTGLEIGGYVAQFGGKNAEAANALRTVTVGAVEPTLYAPYGFTAVSPLTTILSEMDANDGIVGGPTAAANDGNEASLLAAFGLPSTLDLAALDPLAQAQAGDTAPLLIEAKLLDTVTMLSPFFTFDFNSIAAYVGNFGSLDLDSATAIDSMLSGTYTGITLTSDQLASLSAATAASNTAIDTQAAASTSLAATLSSTFAVETVAQGAETADLQYAVFFGDDEDTLTVADVAANYSGAALSGQIKAAQAQETQATSFVADGPATTDAASVVFTITFAKPVTNVSAATFSVIAGSGLTGAHITGVTPVAGGTQYDVTVSTGIGNGTLALGFSGDDLKSVTGAPITDGLFAPAVTTVDPAENGAVEGVAVGDFNGDGLPDVVLTGDATYGATVFMNNGFGSFTAEAPIAGAGYGFDIDVGDVNGDGKLDIIETGTGTSATGDVLSVLLGNGDGTFQKPIDTTVTSTTLAVGDFNGDGRDDVAISTASGIDILLGNGDGSFTTGPTIAAAGSFSAMQTADLNGDGTLDLVATSLNSGAVSIFLGDGHGGFTPAATPTINMADPPDGIAIGDMNGDGIPDIVVTGIELAAGQQNSVEVLLGKGDGSFTSLAPFVYSAAGDTTFLKNFRAGSVAIGDVNNDGKADLVLGAGAGTLVLDGNGDGTFSLGDATSEGTSNFGDQQDIALADVNGDGRTDIVEPGQDQTYGEAQSAAGLDVLLNEAPPVVGSATAPVTIERDGVADPVLSKASGAGTLVRNGNAYTLDLGTLPQGTAVASETIALSNAAAAPSDALDGLFSVLASDGYTVSGASLATALGAGESYAGLTITADTSGAGTHTQTITFAPRDVSATVTNTIGLAGTDASTTTTSSADGADVAEELPAITLTITDAVGPSQPMASLGAPSAVVLPNVRVGDADSQAIAVTNTAAAGNPDLDVTATAAGDAAVTGAVVNLAPGSSDSADVIVGLGTATAGAVSGIVTLAPISDTGAGVALATAPIAVSGRVFRTAVAEATAVSVVLHVGDLGLVPITLHNTAAADGYSEYLAASIAASSAGLQTTAADATGTIVAAGGSDSTLGVTVATMAAGTVTGTATLDLASTGTGPDGSSLDGLAPLALASQAVPITVTVDNYAQAALAETFNGVTQTGTALDLGTVMMGSAPVTLSLAALNTAAGPADLLGGSFSASGSSAFSTELNDVAGIAAGQSEAAGTVTLATGTAGHFTETITFAATGSNASGYSGALPNETVTVTGTVAAAAADAYAIAGEPAVQPTTDIAAIDPFASVTLSNPNAAAFGTATVTQASTANGLLSNLGAGTLSVDDTTYTVSGTTAAIQAALRALVFTPTDHEVAAGQSAATTINLTVADSVSTASAATSVVATAAEDPPVIAGTQAGQAITDQQTLDPFAGVTLTDPDAGASETTTITVAANGTVGTFSGAGLTENADGTYVLAAASPADEQAELRALVFTPATGTGTSGSTVTDQATLSVSDGIATTTDGTTSIVVTQVSTGTAMGDVHLVTLDGLHYDFQADGEFTLARSTVAGDPFDIQIKTTPWDANAATSLTTQVAAQVGTNVVNFALDGGVTVNGVADTALDAAHPVQQLDGGTLTALGAGDYRLDWANGEGLTVDNEGFFLNLHTTVAASDGPGSMQGLLGSLNGQANDLALPDGTVLTQPVPDATLLATFANAWSVSGTGSMLDDGASAVLRPDELGLQSAPSFLAATAPGELLTGSLGSPGGGGMTITGTLADLLGSVIANFAPRDLIDITDLDSATAQVQYASSASGGVLTISQGGHVTSLGLIGPTGSAAVHSTSDLHGGTLLGLA